MSTPTTRTYAAFIAQHGVPTNATLAETHAFVEDVAAPNNWELYTSDATIRETVDIYFGKLNSFVEYQKTAPKAPKAEKPAPKAKAERPAAKEKKAEKKPKSKAEKKAKPAEKAAKPAAAPKTKPAAKAKAAPAPAPAPQNTKATAVKAVKTKAKKAPAAPTGGGVRQLSAAVAHIRRLLALVGKDVLKTRVNALLRSLQTAITEKRISSKDPHAVEINKVQDMLVATVNAAKTEQVRIDLGADLLALLTQKAGGEHVYASVPVIKAFVTMQEREPAAKAVSNLLARAEAAAADASDPLHAQAALVAKHCAAWLKTPGKVKFETRGLSGTQKTRFDALAGLAKSLEKHGRHAAGYARTTKAKATAHAHAGAGCGCGCNGTKPTCGTEKKSPVRRVNKAGLAGVGPAPAAPMRRAAQAPADRRAVMTSAQLMKMQFTLLDITGRWRTLLGRPEAAFKGMIWSGGGGKGKSTLAIDFARYLTQFFGPTWYATSEEPGSYTLQQKLTMVGGSVENLHFAGYVPTSAEIKEKGIKHLFIDSVNNMRYSLADFRDLVKRHPDLAIVLIFQATKGGQFKGEQDWQHDVDWELKMEDGKAVMVKNRFSPLTSITIF